MYHCYNIIYKSHFNKTVGVDTLEHQDIMPKLQVFSHMEHFNWNPI